MDTTQSNHFKCGWLGGWIHIHVEHDGIGVMWTSHLHTHDPLFNSPCYSVMYRSPSLEPYWWGKTALSLWSIHDEKDKRYAERFIDQKLKKAKVNLEDFVS